PYDGASHTMGTAMWNLGVPAGYNTIVLHINDLSGCRLAYPNQTFDALNSTCFVLPSTRQEAQPLAVSKDATGTDKDTFTWTITKSVDKTTVKQVGGTATFNYTVSVSHDAGSISMVKVAGTIT